MRTDAGDACVRQNSLEFRRFVLPEAGKSGIGITHRRTQLNALETRLRQPLQGPGKILGDQKSYRPGLAPDREPQRLRAQNLAGQENAGRSRGTGCLNEVSPGDERHRVLRVKKSLQFPSRTARRAYQLLRGIGIGDLQVGAIPVERLRRRGGDISEQQRFRHLALEFKIASWLGLAAFCGIQPFPFVARGARQGFRGWLETGHLRVRNQLGIRAIETAQDLPAIADKEQTLVALFAITPQRTIFREFRRTRRFQPAIIPAEFDRRHIAARREVVAHNGSERVGFRVAIGRAGFDPRGRFQLENAENGVEAVGPHIAESATTKVNPAAPYEGQVSVIEGTFRSRPQPQVPIQTFRHRVGVFGTLDRLCPERTARPIRHLAHRTDRTRTYPLRELAGGFGSLVGDRDLGCDPSFPGDLGQPARLINRVGQWFLTEDVLPFLHGRRGNRRVQIVGRAHHDGVNIFFLFEQFAEIAVGGTAAIVAGALPASVIGVNDLLAWFAPRNPGWRYQRMGQLNGSIGAQPIPAARHSEPFLDRLGKFVRIPLRVIGARFRGIADGNTLDVRLAEEVKHDAQALRAHADESNVDLVARRNKAETAQDSPGDNGQAYRRLRRLRQERTPRGSSASRISRMGRVNQAHSASSTAGAVNLGNLRQSISRPFYSKAAARSSRMLRVASAAANQWEPAALDGLAGASTRSTDFVLSSGTRSISSAKGSMPALSGSLAVTKVKVEFFWAMCTRSR